MKRSTLLFSLILLFVGCSSDSAEPEVINEPEEEVVVEEETEGEDAQEEEMEEEVNPQDEDTVSDIPFEKIIIIGTDFDNATLQSIYYETELSPNGEFVTRNLSQEFGFQDLISFELQSNGDLIFFDDLGIGSDGKPIRKVVIRNVQTGTTFTVENYFELIGSNDFSKIFSIKSSSKSIVGLVSEDEIVDGNTFTKYGVFSTDLALNSSEQIWSTDDAIFNQKEVEFGNGLLGSGIIVNDDYLSLDYDILDSPSQGQYFIDVFDMSSMQPIKSIDFESPMRMIQQMGNHLLLSKPGKLELYDLLANTIKSSENESVVSLRIDDAFINESKLVFGRIAGNSSFNSLRFLNFDSNEFKSIEVHDLRGSLLHIPSNSPIELVDYTVDFENDIYLIVYSYVVSGNRKYELAVFKWDGELIKYFELPPYNVSAIYFN